jgi:hypothetical protein
VRIFHPPPPPSISKLFLSNFLLQPQSPLTWSRSMSVSQHNSNGRVGASHRQSLQAEDAVQQLSGPAVRAESRPGRIGRINLGAKQTGERKAGNPHAAFDMAGTGNVAWSRCCDTRRRKGETIGNKKVRGAIGESHGLRTVCQPSDVLAKSRLQVCWRVSGIFI